MMGNTMPLADQVYILQSNVIKELAAQGPCVILGRCGDYVLRERPNVLRTFVYAPLDARIGFAKSRPDAKDMPDRLWETQLAKHDRARASYYNYYTENRWGAVSYTHLHSVFDIAQHSVRLLFTCRLPA